MIADVVAELDELYADGPEVSFQALREIPQLESALKETLRLHPPLILLLRVAQEDFEVAGYPIPPGDDGGGIARGLEPDRRGLPGPGRVRPGPLPRPAPGGPASTAWTWIPFGAGRHRCVGAAFAMMQLKAIFSVLLRDYEFEMAQPSESYRERPLEDGRAARPARQVRYRRR